jgi:hypothetical protein
MALGKSPMPNIGSGEIYPMSGVAYGAQAAPQSGTQDYKPSAASPKAITGWFVGMIVLLVLLRVLYEVAE